MDNLSNQNWNFIEYLKINAPERTVSAKTLLLSEGEIAKNVFIIKKGCLRMWFNKDGKDITMQFFLENSAVASIDSFISGEPSLFNIESVEPCELMIIDKALFEDIQRVSPDFSQRFNKILFQRFRNYAQLFLSRIRDTPQERYEALIKEHPEIIQRIPQHYIASYLGITPISLSRIRNRL
jgi:CRP-like cAMP-binding protein